MHYPFRSGLSGACPRGKGPALPSSKDQDARRPFPRAPPVIRVLTFGYVAILGQGKSSPRTKPMSPLTAAGWAFKALEPCHPVRGTVLGCRTQPCLLLPPGELLDT